MSAGMRRANAGFTLLEILIAFAIATTTLGLLFRIHGNSTATVALSTEYRDAVVLAQTLVAEHSVTEHSRSFARTGATEKYAWSIQAVDYGAAAMDSFDERAPYELRKITVNVRWAARDRNRQIALHTVKPFFESKQ